MKKVFYILFFISCLFPLISCDSDLKDNNIQNDVEFPNYNEDTGKNPEEDYNTEELPNISLDKPVLTIDQETGIVTWNSINNATHYNYIINDSNILSTTNTAIELPNECTVSVQAANNDAISDWSYAVTNFDTSDVYEEYVEYVYVKFHNTDLPTIKIKSGEKIDVPNASEKANYSFDNWYKDPFIWKFLISNNQLHPIQLFTQII